MIGHPKAAELLMLGEAFSANTARELGIVNDVYEKEVLFSETQKVIDKLVRKSPEMLQLTKALLKKPEKILLNETIRLELEHIIQCLASPEAREHFQAFLNRK